VDGARVLAGRAVANGTGADTLTAAHCALLLAALFHGDIAEARSQSDLLLQHAERPTTIEAHQYQPWFCAGLLAAETDDLTGVAHLSSRGREVAVAAGSAWAVPAYDALSAFAALRAGHLGDAEAHARAALDYSDEVDSFGIVVWCHAFVAQVGLARGEVEVARRHTDAAEAILATGRSGFGLDHVAHTRAMLHVVGGDLEAAHAVLRGIWDAFTVTSLDLPRQWMGPALARLCAQTDRLDDAVEVADQLEQAAHRLQLPVAQADALVARAWAARDPSYARAAAEVLRATPRTIQRADGLVAAAVLSRRSGNARDVPDLVAEAAAAYESVGATAWADAAVHMVKRRRSTPRAVQGLEALTKSERAVLDLVATGLTNTQIADELHLSRRTVESHVSAAYRKLGVDTRVELANAVNGGALAR
jgi:DNA-binding NarL/FixJ family response regulator